MKTSDFNFDLPEELIAQVPIKDRTSSKLMVLNKETGEIEHRIFKDIIDYLNPGDCLVLNDTRVIPARLIGSKVETGGKIEFLLLKRTEDDTWETLVKPGKRAKIGARFSFGDGKLIAEVVGMGEDGARIVKFEYNGIFEEILDELGNMPLPPYITEKGVDLAFVTLHVGLGTFRPVKVDDVNSHQMHSEFYMVTEEAAEKINRAKANGNRVISVGTTSTRTIESVADENGLVKATSGWTNIFIYPGYKWKVIDNLITNFHLPESTLIMLVSSLAGKEHVLNAYNQAVKDKYRFFSFGDAMFIK